jgi:hypothetical protein
MGAIKTCPLCKSGEAERNSQRIHVFFARCYCGEWEFTDQDIDIDRIGSESKRWLLSAWLRHRWERLRQPYLYSNRERGQLPVGIREPSVLTKIDETLLAIAERSAGFGSLVDLDLSDLIPLVWARDRDEATHLLDHLASRRLTGGIGDRVSLTADGWARVEQLRAVQPGGRLAFVAMWFVEELDAIFDQAIEPALTKCGYDAYRVDRAHFREKIDDHVLAQVRRASLAIVDCTGQRPNAYFEAGFAMGLGVPVIWTCREREKLHFDIQQYPCLFWRDAGTLQSQLEARVQALYPLDRSAVRP